MLMRVLNNLILFNNSIQQQMKTEDPCLFVHVVIYLFLIIIALSHFSVGHDNKEGPKLQTYHRLEACNPKIEL